MFLEIDSNIIKNSSRINRSFIHIGMKQLDQYETIDTEDIFLLNKLKRKLSTTQFIRHFL